MCLKIKNMHVQHIHSQTVHFPSIVLRKVANIFHIFAAQIRYRNYLSTHLYVANTETPSLLLLITRVHPAVQ